MSILNPSNPNKNGGIGIPPGGTTGQVLTKKSDDDYDTYWSDVDGGSFAPPEEEGVFEWWSPEMTSNVTPAPYSCEADSITNDTVPVYHAFDGISDPGQHSFWCSVYSGNNHWIQFNFGESGATIYGLRMKPSNYSGRKYYNQIPKTFKIETSMDGAGWTTVYEETEGGPEYRPELCDWYECSFSRPIDCKHIRLTMVLNYEDQTYPMLIAEIEFYKLVTTAQLIAQQKQIRADLDYISIMTGVDLT